MDLAIILRTLPAIGIQVCESIGRKTGSKITAVLETDMVPNALRTHDTSRASR